MNIAHSTPFLRRAVVCGAIVLWGLLESLFPATVEAIGQELAAGSDAPIWLRRDPPAKPRATPAPARAFAQPPATPAPLAPVEQRHKEFPPDLRTGNPAILPVPPSISTPGTTLPVKPPAQPLKKSLPAAATPAAQAGELNLSEIGALLFKPDRASAVHLCFAGVRELSLSEIAQGAVIIQGLALRAGDTPLIVSHGPKLLPGRFNVLVGLRDQVQAYLPKGATFQASYLGLNKLPGSGEGSVLVVTGTTSASVNDAILSLGLASVKLPNAPMAVIREVVLPSAPSFLRQQPLKAGSTQTFGELGEAGTPVQALPDGGSALDLYFPGAFSIAAPASVRLNLHFNQRNGSLRSSPIIVKVNHAEAARSRDGSIRLSPISGSETTLDFPLSALLPGINRLEISHESEAPSSSGSAFGSQAASRGDGFGIFADSTLTIPKLTEFVSLPDLQVTARTFFPFIGQPDGSEISMLLVDAAPETINSAWMLLGKLAQSSNTLLYRIEFAPATSSSSRHVLIVGEQEAIPRQWKEFLGIQVFQRAAPKLIVKVAEVKNLRNLVLNQYRHLITERAAWKKEKAEPVKLAMPETLRPETDYGFLACRLRPDAPSRWILSLTAFSPAALQQRTERLVSTECWDQLQTDTARWTEAGHVETHAVEKFDALIENRSYVEMPLGERLDLKIWVTVLCGILFVFTLLTSNLLKRFEQMVILRQRQL